jgi:alpha,alpha-trehalase
VTDVDIADYALISNCRAAGLVSRHGSIDWLCLPRFDAPSVFARILDEEAGSWWIRPAEEYEVERAYRNRTLVLETTFTTPGGSAVLTDALESGPNEGGHELGDHATPVLLRSVACTRGTITVDMCFAPRPEYGLVDPLLHSEEGGIIGRGGPSVLLLSLPEGVQLETEASTARARLRLTAGDRLGLALQHAWSWEDPPHALGQGQIRRRLEETTESWQKWSGSHEIYDGPRADLVDTSARVLQGLTYEPTGAMVAAPTTSIATEIGGSRNWDYRYTWLRDTSFTIEALRVSACVEESKDLFGFIARTALSQVRRHGDVQAVYGIGGEHDLTERELSHLSGWRDSRPVRVGNAAWNQHQLDVYGELIGAVYQLREELEEEDPLVRRFLVQLADVAAARWREEDHGIWEMRTPAAHYVHSKLMCWVALDRSIQMADVLGAEEAVDRWSVEREAVREAILTRGWSETLGSFRQTFDRDVLDASTLMIPIVGFLDPCDERVLGTLEAIESGLMDERGLVRRYSADDGLDGSEGSFLLCTFWLTEAWARAGRIGRAKELFDRAAGYANDLGLLSEQVDSNSGRLLGNFPQAFSHIGLVNAGFAIAHSEATSPTP